MDEYIEGEAERIEHDAKAEKTEFFGRARVKSGLDEVRGQFISYDARTEQYVVTSGPNGTRAPSGSRERVRAVIQPRNKDAAAPVASPGPGASLKNTQDFNSQRQETAK
jgi:lipopolysaccharide export system protein LptA